MDSPFMELYNEFACLSGLAIARFEFSYMAERRKTDGRRPPPRADKLIGEFESAISRVRDEANGKLAIGGKSMGGRVAAMVAGGERASTIEAVVCLGYPLHPPGKPDNLRLPPLLESKRPVLICQGKRDPLGTREEIDDLDLPEFVTAHWLEDGDHDFKPRKRAGVSWQENVASAAEATARFLNSLA